MTHALNTEPSEMCMIACHTWDTVGAQAAGWEAGLIKGINNDTLDSASQRNMSAWISGPSRTSSLPAMAGTERDFYDAPTSFRDCSRLASGVTQSSGNACRPMAQPQLICKTVANRPLAKCYQNLAPRVVLRLRSTYRSGCMDSTVPLEPEAKERRGFQFRHGGDEVTFQ